MRQYCVFVATSKEVKHVPMGFSDEVGRPVLATVFKYDGEFLPSEKNVKGGHMVLPGAAYRATVRCAQLTQPDMRLFFRSLEDRDTYVYRQLKRIAELTAINYG